MATKPAKKKSGSARTSATSKRAKTKSTRVVTNRSSAKRLSLAASIKALQMKILKDKQKLAALRHKLPLELVQDYTFSAHNGSPIRLSELFGSKRDLILIHNMGRGCSYCTLWADGFTGFTKHLENRAGFVVISKDPVDVQKAFYESRGWNFKMYSSIGSSFNREMGYESEKGGQLPGVSAFHKDASGKIFRTGTTALGPGDDFCSVWHLLDLLKDGPNGWEPKYQY